MMTEQELYNAVSPTINGLKWPLPLPQEPWYVRQQRRLAFRNEKTLYKRNCDLSGRALISTYSPDSTFKVYGQEEYWSDAWDARTYGKDFNFTRSFFEQFAELMKEVPRLALVNKQSENSEHCDYSFANKNCYLLFGSHYEEDCMYGRYSTKNKNCIDTFWIYGCELCYECTFSKNCHRGIHLDHCQDSSDCLFSMDLKGCEHCLFSFGLRHKKYHIFNKPYSKEDYEAYLQKLNLSDYNSWQSILASWKEYKKENAIFRAQYQTNCENCEGTEHQNSKELINCFACSNCEHCANGFQMDETYSSIDNSHLGYDRCELCNNCIGCSGIYNCISCDSCWHNNNMLYCNLCFTSNNCFGSIGMRRNEYCILNKQCTKEEYEHLLPRIIEHMQKSGEWGQFFPTKISPYAYNETTAQEFCPLTKEEVLAQGWRWRDEEVRVPQSSSDQIVTCEVTGKAFKILPKELEFYKQMGVPLPRRHPDQRMRDRVDLPSFMQRYNRNCEKTGKPVQTIYSPEMARHVYSEEAYLKEIY